MLDLDAALEMISRLPQTDGIGFDYDSQLERLEEEIEKCQGMKLYEDLASGIIDREEYSEFRGRYNASISEKKEALGRIRQEKKDAAAVGVSERQWVSLFRENGNIGELNRRVLMALVDKILVHEDHGIEIHFKYGTEYRQASEFAERYAGRLRMAR